MSFPRHAPTTRTPLRVESLEDRVVPTSSGVPPEFVNPQPATTVTLNGGGDASGTAAITAREFDYFRVTLPAGRTTFRVESLASTLDPVIGVYTAAGRRVAFNDDATTAGQSGDSETTVSLPAGTYFLAVTNFAGSTGGAYRYTIDAPAPPRTDDAFENNDTFRTAFNFGPLASVRTVGNLMLADTADFYRFTMTRAGTAANTVSIAFSNARGNLNLLVLDASGRLLRAAAGQGDRESVSLNGLPAGTYIAQVIGGPNPAYSLTVNPGRVVNTVPPAGTPPSPPAFPTPTPTTPTTPPTPLPTVPPTGSPATISGRVFVDADGNGSFGAGDTALFSVTVEVFDSAGFRVGQPAKTATDGTYTFTGLGAGTYRVQETHPSGFTDGTDYANGTAVPGSNKTDAVTLTLVAGQTATATFTETVPVPPPPPPPPPPPTVISGRVFSDIGQDGTLGAGDTALELVAVGLYDAAGTTLLDTAITDIGGNYSFAGLAPGSYTIKQTQPTGYVDGRDYLNGVFVTGSTTTDAVAVTGLAAGTTATVTFTETPAPPPPPPATISGQVFVDVSPLGGTLGAGDTAIAGVTVGLYDAAGTTLLTTTATDASGNYSFTGVAPGSYKVKESQPFGNQDGFDYLNGTKVSGSDTSDVVAVTVAAGATATVTFTELPPPPTPATVTGRVFIDPGLDGTFGTGDTPLFGLTVGLYDAAGTTLLTTAPTGSNGTYTINNVAAGSYTVKATGPGWYTDGKDYLNGTFVTGSVGTDAVAVTVAGGATATVNFTENPLPPVTPVTSNFQITFDLSALTTAQQTLLQPIVQQAANRWQEIITGDLPSRVYAGVTIDDLLIEVKVASIDGANNTLAQAGPRNLRSGSLLPYRGEMTFDSADLGASTSDMVAISAHEIGHVLGIGTLWDASWFNLVDLAPTPPTFKGAQANAEYLARFPTRTGGVAIEAGGGAGTAGAHWDETLLRNELMTGFITLGSGVNPITRITIASLADMGYTVNLTAADNY